MTDISSIKPSNARYISHLRDSIRKAVVWRRPGGLPECPYFRLSMIKFPWFSLRVHEWLGDDDDRALHDHPHWFITFVLRGGYVDVSRDNCHGLLEFDHLMWGSVRFRRANFAHKVTLVQPGTVTLLLTGPSTRRWGFWQDGKLIKRDKWFATAGHHPCPGRNVVRLRPEGTRI